MTTYLQHEELSSAFDPAPLSPLSRVISPEQKWIAVSQLQKAIRRSKPDIALEWAHALWNADRSYGLFRLAVIAAEDIAGADPALARAYLQSEIKKPWFDDKGGFSCLAYFVDAFARSPKDRASCDLAATASLTHLTGIARPRGELDYPALRELAENPEAPIPARISALWLLAGTQKIPNAELGQDRPGRLVSFLGACSTICPDTDVLACIDLSLRLNKEPNPIALALCRAAQAQPGVSISLEAPTRIVGGALTCAVDAHTREGRAALDDLLAQSRPAQALCSALRSRQEKSKLLGSVFFRLEGHDVAPRLDYPLAQRARSWHRKRLARISEIGEPELFEQALALLPELDALRIHHASWAFAPPAPSLIRTPSSIP